jgi:hypothetical protein
MAIKKFLILWCRREPAHSAAESGASMWPRTGE